jgi:hypothetical protein
MNCNFVSGVFYNLFWSVDFLHTPNSLRGSNVSPKLKTTKGQGVEARSLARNIIKG